MPSQQYLFTKGHPIINTWGSSLSLGTPFCASSWKWGWKPGNHKVKMFPYTIPNNSYLQKYAPKSVPEHTCPAKSDNTLCCPDKREAAAAARSACSSGRKIHTQQQYCGVSGVLSVLCSLPWKHSMQSTHNLDRKNDWKTKQHRCSKSAAPH